MSQDIERQALGVNQLSTAIEDQSADAIHEEVQLESSAEAAPAHQIPAPVKLTPEMLHDAFRRTAKPYNDKASGELGATLTSVCPFVYFAIVAGLLWCVVILAFRTRPELTDGMPTLRGFIAWFAPIAAGLAMLYYMIKPLFQKTHAPEREQEISPGNQPLLFTLINEVVRCAKVPMPARVFVDCGTTVHARLARHSPGNKALCVHLTIGLTLLCSTNVRQIAAAICAELGRFRNGGGPALRVRKTVEWLGRVVAHRDAFDETLDEFSQKSNRVVRTLGVFLKWMVRVIRGLITGLLSAVTFLGRSTARHQQLQADFSAAQLCGPIEYTALLMQAQSLQITNGIAERNLKRIIRDSLPENLPAFVAASRENVPQQVRQQFQQQAEHDKPTIPLLDPNRTDRLACLSRLDRVPLINLDCLAQPLLVDFDNTCARATVQHYKHIYGEDYLKAWLRPNPEFMSQIGYSIYQPSTYDTMIDYHEGDKWYIWRKRLSTAGGILMTVGLVTHAGFQIAKAAESEETKLRRNIGQAVLVHDVGLRKITDVRYLKEGEIVGYDTEGDPNTVINAPDTGWYYDTGDNMVVPTDRAVLLGDMEEEEQSDDMKLALEQMKMNSRNMSDTRNSATPDQ